MNKINFNKAKFTRSINRLGLKCKKNSPEILVITGVLGTVISAVLACKATTKVHEVKEQLEDDLNFAHLTGVVAGCEEQKDNDEYTDEDIEMMRRIESTDVSCVDENDIKTAKRIAYVKAAAGYAKLYAPAVLIGAVSITCILSSHGIMKKRNVALSAAYATVSDSFKNYRERLIEKCGKELDNELRFGGAGEAIKSDEESTSENDSEKRHDVEQYSDFARCYCEGCRGWSKDPETNLMFLRHQQNAANDILHSRGRLYLNEVYEMLGIPKTKAGHIAGWIYDESENSESDNYVDFGIYNLDNQNAKDFVNGKERSIWLDFNVDKNIWAKL